MKIVKCRAPAKINYRLDVLNKRSDGFHDLRMVNSAVTLYDDIEIELTERGITVECENDTTVPDGENNVVYQVAKEILAYSNKNIGVKIRIKKNIPSAAGMGGGSSNAAAVLMTLNSMLKINLSKDKLIAIGVRFGADVPFFILESPALAEGVGDKLHKIKKMPKMPLVLVSPNIRVETKWAFERFDTMESENQFSEPQKLDEDIPLQFATKKSVIRFLNNDLEKVTMQKYPALADIKQALTKLGALATQMTGSGPTVFGIFPDQETAQTACTKLSKIKDCRVFLVENIN